MLMSQKIFGQYFMTKKNMPKKGQKGQEGSPDSG